MADYFVNDSRTAVSRSTSNLKRDETAKSAATEIGGNILPNQLKTIQRKKQPSKTGTTSSSANTDDNKQPGSGAGLFAYSIWEGLRDESSEKAKAFDLSEELKVRKSFIKLSLSLYFSLFITFYTLSIYSLNFIQFKDFNQLK